VGRFFQNFVFLYILTYARAERIYAKKWFENKKGFPSIIVRCALA